MTKLVQVYTLLMIGICGSCHTESKTKALTAPDSTAITKNIVDWNKRWKIKDYESFTKSYSETASLGVIIESSFPKGCRYIDPSRKGFECRIFWNRVVNESASPIQLTINFPADSFQIIPGGPHVKLFFAPEALTFAKEPLHEYHVTDLESFLESFDDRLTNDKVTTVLQRTINPKEEYFFNIGLVFYHSTGIVRAGLVLKEEELFYRIGIKPYFESAILPCGKIVFKN